MTTPRAALTLAAGLATPALAQTSALRYTRGVPVAQIRVNLATGDRTVHPWNAQHRSDSPPVWLNNNTDPCLTGELVWVLDDPDTDGDGASELFGLDCASGIDLPCEGVWHNYVGDLHHPNAVIDRFVIRHGTNNPPTRPTP